MRVTAVCILSLDLLAVRVFADECSDRCETEFIYGCMRHYIAVEGKTNQKAFEICQKEVRDGSINECTAAQEGDPSCTFTTKMAQCEKEGCNKEQEDSEFKDFSDTASEASKSPSPSPSPTPSGDDDESEGDGSGDGDVLPIILGVVVGVVVLVLCGLVWALKKRGPQKKAVPTLAPGYQWHFFLSHAQASGGDQMGILNSQLTDRGFKVWYDQTAKDVTESGMKYGVTHSRCFLLFLSKGVLERPFVRLEIETALANNSKTLLLKEDDPRKGAFDFSKELEGVPEDILNLVRAHNAIPFQRVHYLQLAMLEQIVKESGIADECSNAQEAVRKMDTE